MAAALPPTKVDWVILQTGEIPSRHALGAAVRLGIRIPQNLKDQANRIFKQYAYQYALSSFSSDPSFNYGLSEELRTRYQTVQAKLKTCVIAWEQADVRLEREHFQPQGLHMIKYMLSQVLDQAEKAAQ